MITITTQYAVRDAETKERLTGFFRYRKDAEAYKKLLNFNGLVLEVYRTSHKLLVAGA